MGIYCLGMETKTKQVTDANARWMGIRFLCLVKSKTSQRISWLWNICIPLHGFRFIEFSSQDKMFALCVFPDVGYGWKRPSDDSCQHRTWERVQAASENESSGNARENLTRWLRRWRQELYQQEYRNFRNIWCYAEPNGLLLVLNMLVGWQTQMLRSLNKWLGCVPRQKKWLMGNAWKTS